MGRVRQAILASSVEIIDQHTDQDEEDGCDHRVGVQIER
jgi:hypothetical protein